MLTESAKKCSNCNNAAVDIDIAKIMKAVADWQKPEDKWQHTDRDCRVFLFTSTKAADVCLCFIIKALNVLSSWLKFTSSNEIKLKKKKHFFISFKWNKGRFLNKSLEFDLRNATTHETIWEYQTIAVYFLSEIR